VHPRIARRYDIGTEEAEAFVGRLSDEGMVLADPVDPPRVVPDDPNDDYLVALGIASDADALVTRDRHFAKVRVAGLPIIAPRELIRRLGRP
jgi:predicted nucleic acid-binding protein